MPLDELLLDEELELELVPELLEDELEELELELVPELLEDELLDEELELLELVVPEDELELELLDVFMIGPPPPPPLPQAVIAATVTANVIDLNTALSEKNIH